MEQKTIQTLFMKTFRENAGKVFIRKYDKWPEYTYEDVYESACLLASYLTEQGIMPNQGKRIGIYLDRSPQYIISFFSCLMFGYAAVLMDTAYPKERVHYISQDSSLEYTLDKIAYEKAVTSGKPVCAPVLSALETTEAIMVYTSGSTGNPKGVIHTQRSVYDGAVRLAQVLGLTCNDLLSSVAPFTFVAHMVELIVPFVSGSRIVIFPSNAAKDAVILSNMHKNEEITASIISPKILRYYRKSADTLRLVITGTEKVSNIYLEDCRLISLYGQSETYLTYTFVIDHAYDVTPIGFPMHGIISYLMDDNGNISTEGELCLAGNFFSGYNNLPEKTAQAIQENPFAKDDGFPTLVHTGDLCRKLPDGNLLYLNRKDWMIKINGQRVEPGEIEIVLRNMDGISDAVVKDFENKSHNIFLCAYYICNKGIKVDCKKIRAYLTDRLPAYMIPAFFVELEALPVNQNGKLDRLALKAPEAETLQAEYIAPTNPAEQAICEVFAEVLDLKRVSITDDFFALGGDSISVVAASVSLEALNVSAKLIYAKKTAKDIAKALKTGTAEGPSEKEIEVALSSHPKIIPYQRYYIDYQLYTPKGTGTLIPQFIRIFKPEYSYDEIRKALEQVFSHFAIFESVFEYCDDGELRLVRKPDLAKPFEVLFMSEQEAKNELAEDVARPFSPIGHLLYRCKLCVCRDDMYILYFAFQHALVDGSAIMQMLSAMMDILHKNTLWPDAYYYYLNCVEINRKLPEYQKKLAELRKKYCDNGYARLPFSDKALSDTGNVTSYYPVPIPFHIMEKYAEKAGASLGLLFSASGLLALRDYNHTDKVQINWIYSSRDENWTKRLVGLTMTALPVAIDFDSISDYEQLLKEIKTQNNDNIPYSTLAAALEDNSPALNDTLNMIYEGEIQYPANFFKNYSEEFLYDRRTSIATLMECGLIVDRGNDSMTIFLNYSGSRYDTDSAGKFAGLVIKYLCELVGES